MEVNRHTMRAGDLVARLLQLIEESPEGTNTPVYFQPPNDSDVGLVRGVEMVNGAIELLTIEERDLDPSAEPLY